MKRFRDELGDKLDTIINKKRLPQPSSITGLREDISQIIRELERVSGWDKSTLGAMTCQTTV